MKIVHLISGGDTGGAKTHVLLLVRALAEHIPIKLVCLTPGEFYQDAGAMGLPVVLLEQTRRWDLSVASRLHDLLDEFDADVLHCHGARANFVAALLRRRLAIPIVTTIHSDYRRDFEDNLYKHLIYTTLNSLSLRRFDHYIAVTEQFRSMLQERGFPPDRLFTVYNGLDFSAHLDGAKSSFRRDWSIPDDAPVVGTVGRLAAVKRHDVFLGAAKLLQDAHPGARFVVVGDGPEGDSLKRQAEQMGMGSRIVFTGHMGDVDSALAAFDVNVLCSESESFPYALLEGARMRLPTVATAVGGVVDLVQDGETGLISPVGDDRELACALDSLLLDPDLGRRLGEALYQHARRSFSLESMGCQHLEIYRKIIDAAHARSPEKILVSGYFGFGNTGDEALLDGMISGLRGSRDNLEITVLSTDPETTAECHRTRAVHRFSPVQVLRALGDADLFISGGGTLLQDETSLRSLVYYASLIHLALASGAKVMIYANGLGPLHTRTGRFLARRCLERADAVTLRDRDSLKTAQNLGVRRSMEVTADPAFSLLPGAQKQARELLYGAGVPPDAKPVLISLRPWGEATARIAEVTARAADLLYERGYYPVFCAMQPKLDGPVSRAAAEGTDCPNALIGDDLNPRLALALMAQGELTIGMRLHALILSAAAGVPPLGLSYDPKVEGFLADIGLPPAGHVQDLTYEQLASVLTEVFLPDLPRWRRRTAEAAASMRRLAEQNTYAALSLLDQG